MVLDSEKVDAVVCDMAMPGGSGIDVHGAISREHPGLEQRMIFVTGGGQDEEQRRFLRTVPNPVFQKPPELQEVFEAIYDAVERCSVPPSSSVRAQVTSSDPPASSARTRTKTHENNG